MSRPTVRHQHMKELRDALDEDGFVDADVKTEPHQLGEVIKLKAKHGGRELVLSLVCSEGMKQEHLDYQMASWRRMLKRFVNPRKEDE
jgi:hypothetical protein